MSHDRPDTRESARIVPDDRHRCSRETDHGEMMLLDAAARHRCSTQLLPSGDAHPWTNRSLAGRAIRHDPVTRDDRDRDRQPQHERARQPADLEPGRDPRRRGIRAHPDRRHLNQAFDALSRAQRADTGPTIDAIWVLDSDCVVLRPDALTQALDAMTTTGAAIVGQPVWDEWNRGTFGLHALLIDPAQVWRDPIAPFAEDGEPSRRLKESCIEAELTMTPFGFTADGYIVHLGHGTLAQVAARVPGQPLLRLSSGPCGAALRGGAGSRMGVRCDPRAIPGGRADTRSAHGYRRHRETRQSAEFVVVPGAANSLPC